MPDIDSLQIQVNASAEDASKGLDALYSSLEKLKNATKGGLGLTFVANHLTKLNAATSKLSSLGTTNLKATIDALTGLESLQGLKVSSTIARSITDIGDASSHLSAEGVVLLKSLAPALSSLSAMQNVKISPTIGREISSIMTATSSINTADLSKIAELSNAVSSLANLSRIRISSTIATQIINLGIAAEQLQGIDLSIFGNLAEALHPLSELGRVTNLSSTLTQLKKLPEIMNQMSSADLETFKQQVRDLADALEPLSSRMQSVAAGFAAFPQRIQRLIQSTNSLSNTNYRVAGSYTDFYSKLRMAATAVRTVARTIAGWIKESNEYVENLNLFNASMGEYAQSAQRYAERVGDLMGIDPSTWMRNQGVFMTLATGFGVVSDRAFIMSQNLTQLGYDLSSFFNIRVDDSMQKLQSGISGELEPLRRLGYDLSQARLEAVALELGITKAFNAMTQAEKSQLRYYAIMTQVTTAQGDMARTLDAPANQLRVLQAQVTQAARALGNIFIPILNAVLPYCIAVAKAVRLVAAAIASLFGFTLPDIDYSGIGGGIGDVTGGVGDLGNALDGAGGSAKKLKSYLMGFDELNVLNDTDSSGGGGSGGGGGSSDWDWDLPVYDFLDGLVSDRINGLMKEFQPILDWIQEHLDTILAVAGAITAELLLWKVAKALIPDLGTIRGDLTKILSVATASATIAITAYLVYKFDNKYMETGKWGYLVADGIATAMGAYISGKVIAHAFGTTAGYYTAAATLAISAGTTLNVVFDHVSQEGFDKKALTSSIWSVIKGAAAGGLLAVAIGASVVSGIAVGAVLTAAVALVVNVAAYSLHQNWVSKAIMYGNLALTAAEIKKTAESLFSIDVTSTINLAKTQIENEERARSSLNTSLGVFNSSINKIEVGSTITDEDIPTMLDQLTGENGVIPQLQKLLDEKKATVELATSFIPPVTTDGKDMSQSLMDAMSLGDDVLKTVGDSIGQRLSSMIQEGMVTGFANGEDLIVAELNQWLNRITTAVANGQVAGEFSAELQILLTDLNRESFAGVIGSYNSMVEELSATYTELEKQAYADAVAYAAGLEQAAQYYDSIGDTVNADKAREALDLVNAQIEGWDIQGSVQKAVDAAIEPGKKQIFGAFQSIFGGAMNTIIEQRPFTDLAMDAMNGLFADMTPENATEWSDGVAKRISKALEYSLGKEDYQVAISVADTLNLTEWDLLTRDLQAQVFGAFEDAFGSEEAWTIFKDLGYDMSGMLATGIANGSYQISNEAGDLVVTLKNGTKVALGKQNEAIVALFDSLGVDIVDGMVAGIDGEMTAEIQTLLDLFGIPYEKAAEENQVNSPSLLFKQLGIYIVEGLIAGLGTLVTKLKDTWTTLPDWFQNFINIIVSKFTGMNADVGQLFEDGKSTIQSSWSKESFTTIGNSAILGLIGGLLSEKIPVLEPAVSLVKKGWKTVTSWVNGLFGNTDNDESIGLLKSGWNTVSSWVHGLFGDTNNDESVTLVRDGWKSVSEWVHGLFGNTNNDESVALQRNSWTTVTGWVNSQFGSTDNDERISLVRNGWSTVTKWVNGLFGNTDNDESIGLLKSGWNTVSSWVNDRMGNTDVIKGIGITNTSAWSTVASWISNNKMGGSVSKSIGLKTGWSGIKGLATVAAWLLLDSIFGGNVTKAVDLKKGNWANKSIAQWCADNSTSETGTVTINLAKGNWTSLSSFVTSSWTRTLTVNLRKGSGVTWNGKISGSGSYTKISFYKEGGFPDAGQMFIAREAGPELVGSIGNRTAVANNDQIVEAVAAGVYSAVSTAMSEQSGGGGRIVVNLDGKTIYENQQDIARGRGYDLGMGAFSFG